MRQNTTLLGLHTVTYARSRERPVFSGLCDCSLALPQVPAPRVDNGENWRGALARSNSWNDSGSRVALIACEKGGMSEAQALVPRCLRPNVVEGGDSARRRDHEEASPGALVGCFGRTMILPSAVTAVGHSGGSSINTLHAGSFKNSSRISRAIPACFVVY